MEIKYDDDDLRGSDYLLSSSPDIHVVGIGLRFYPGYLFFIFSSFFRQLLSELTAPNSTKTCHMFASEPDLKTHVQNRGVLLPKNWGTKTTYFQRLSTTSQLNGNFGGKYLWNKTWYRQSAKGHWKVKRVPYTVPELYEFRPTNGLEYNLHFTHPP